MPEPAFPHAFGHTDQSLPDRTLIYLLPSRYIALCRSLNIPARYCTGYLGDTGAPPVDAPMDYAGWFEAYLVGAFTPD